MRYFLLFLTLLLASGAAVAQNPPAATRPDLLPAAQAAPDTAAAIHRLFVSKRRAFRYVTLGTIAAVGTAIAIVAAAPDDEGSGGGGGFNPIAFSGSSSSGPAIFGIALCSVPVLLVETFCCAGWSRKKERRALEAWQTHHLSAFYQRKLKPKYFR